MCDFSLFSNKCSVGSFFFFQLSPFNKITSVNGTKVFDGYCMEILQLLSEVFNFTLAIEEEHVYGGITDQGWSGMVGKIIKKV